MKLFYFSLLIIEAFKTILWAKVSQVHRTSNGWAFVITDTLHGDEYVCCAFPVKSTKFVSPNTAEEFLAMTKKDEL